MYTRSEWLTALKKEIDSLPEDEQQNILSFYNDLFEDKFVAGMSEYNIISSFGDPVEAGKMLTSDYQTKPVTENDSSPISAAVVEVQTQTNDYEDIDDDDEEKSEEPKVVADKNAPVATEQKPAKKNTAGAVFLGLLLFPICIIICLALLMVVFSVLAIGLAGVAVAIKDYILAHSLSLVTLGVSIIIVGIGCLLLYPIVRLCNKMFTGLKNSLRRIKEGKKDA